MSLTVFLGSIFVSSSIYFYFNKLSGIKKWCLTLWAYVYFRWIKNRPPLFEFDINSSDLGQLGILPLPKAQLVENPRELSTHSHAIDDVRISGVNRKGEVVRLQLSRRHGRRAEVSLYIRLSDNEEYELPHQPDTSVYNTNGKTFSASGLCLEVLEPLRKWRICFNGYLRRKQCTNGKNDIVLIHFNFLWTPINNYVSFPEDYNVTYISKYVSDRNFFPSKFYEATLNENLEHFGQLKGLLKVESKEKNVRILVRGLKQRVHGHEIMNSIQQRLSIQGILHNGGSFHVFVENVTGSLEKFAYGYICPPCALTVLHMQQCHFNISLICKDRFQPQKLTFDFIAGNIPQRLQITTSNQHFSNNYLGENKELIETTYLCNVILNDKPGEGFLQFTKRNNLIDSSSLLPLKMASYPLILQSDVGETSKLIVTLDEEECASGLLVGGKGASLSLMANLKLDQAVVPAAACLTKVAFELHIKEHLGIHGAIQKLQKSCCVTGTPVSLEEECENVVHLIQETQISVQLRAKVKSTLEKISGVDFTNRRYAIRSSAIGEDGEDLSAAGQNETFLGVKGLNEICAAIVKCWASQFAFRSVEYSRQNGQLINRGMAVVLQEMVNADVAGVLFTRHPVTGSPDKMFITSNFGLGESVVSAIVDPDTVVLKRSWDDHLSIDSVQIGSKAVGIVLLDDGGTKEEEVDPLAANECSLPESMALKLGQLALQLEKFFGTSRDIEWAIEQGQIYLLQSRPVTTDNPITEFEIIHEFDSSSRTDNEVYTTANVKEVFPGALNTMTYYTFSRTSIPLLAQTSSWQTDIYKFDPTAIDVFMPTFCGHLFLDMIGQKTMSLKKEKDSITKAVEVGMFGRLIDSDDIAEMAIERYKIPRPFKQYFRFIKLMLKGIFLNKWILRKTAKKFENYPVPTLGLNDPFLSFAALGKSFAEVFEPLYTHVAVTMSSIIWNIIALNVLSSNAEEITMEHYTDFAALTGGFTGAESGNVPASLEELADIIAKEADPQQFSTMSTEDALIWLQNSETESKRRFTEFLRRHGHRGLNEFDMGCVTWGIDPKQVVKAMQAMLKVNQKNKPKTPPKDIIEQIKTPLTPFKKFMLRFILKGCKNNICNREKGKSMLIKTYDSMRLGFRQLGEMMVSQGYFTDPLLIVSFTYPELQDFLKTRSPKLLKRAKYRQRLYKVMNDYKFPEIIRGEPTSIDQDALSVKAAESGERVKGTPVSQGVVRAPARVITNLKDVHTIQAGEILITRGTDIGWTPYFPLLTGIVTEIGGLVSHGAVIARECGLPCLVGIENATKLFQTGDFVSLNATEGYICKTENN